MSDMPREILVFKRKEHQGWLDSEKCFTDFREEQTEIQREKSIGIYIHKPSISDDDLKAAFIRIKNHLPAYGEFENGTQQSADLELIEKALTALIGEDDE